MLDKHGYLSPLEREIMDFHSYYGYEVLEEYGVEEDIRRIVLYHHSFDPNMIRRIPLQVNDCILDNVQRLRTIDMFEVGRELMSRIQVEQMSNNDCLVFVRSLRPFKRRKYELSNHTNYKYLVEADEANAIPEMFQLHFDEEDMETVRVKSVNEEGYIYPPIVDSPRRRAQERAKERKAVAEEKAKVQSRRETSGYRICEETRSAQDYKRNVKAKDAFTGEDATEQLKKLNIDDLQLVDDFDPLYEF